MSRVSWLKYVCTYFYDWLEESFFFVVAIIRFASLLNIFVIIIIIVVFVVIVTLLHFHAFSSFLFAFSSFVTLSLSLCRSRSISSLEIRKMLSNRRVLATTTISSTKIYIYQTEKLGFFLLINHWDPLCVSFYHYTIAQSRDDAIRLKIHDEQTNGRTDIVENWRCAVTGMTVSVPFLFSG